MSSIELSEFVMVKKGRGRRVWRKGGIYELWGELCERTEKLMESAESHEGYYIRQVWNQTGTVLQT